MLSSVDTNCCKMTNKSHLATGSYRDSPRDHDHHYSQGGEQFVWETHQVRLERVPGYGFGIAISGGIDNPHFYNGDPSIAVCDVLNAGPAAGKVEINDRIVSVDNHLFDNIQHAKAIDILHHSPDVIDLVLRRKVYMDIHSADPSPIKIVLKKKSKKDEYGLVIGCRLYVKKIVGNSLAAQEGGLKEGDDILKLNNFPTDSLSLNECYRIMERSREKLSLIVVKDQQNERRSQSGLPPKIDNTDQSQSQHFDLAEDVFIPRSEEPRARPPLPTQLDSSREGPPPYNREGPFSYSPGYSSDGPRLQPVGATTLDSNVDDTSFSRRGLEPRRISFRKSKGGVGIRLAGGNNVGIFVADVLPESAAHEQGLREGDILLQINNTDMQGKTREDAVLLLLSLESQVELLVQRRYDEYERFINSTDFGDSFYVRAHFNNSTPESGQLAFSAGDVFHVRDTLHRGVVGAWKAVLVDRNLQEKQEGIIPNRSGADLIMLNQQQKPVTSAEDRNSSLLRKNFFKRRSARRTKSLNKESWEEMMLNSSKFTAYENVVRKTPSFHRPIVLYGPVADIARKMLLQDDSQSFMVPIRETEGEVIKIAAIRQVVEQGKHCVLDVNPNAVDRLNYAGYYPLVIYLRADTKQTVKEIRSQHIKDTQNSAKLYDESIKLEKLFSYLFSATITLTSNGSWYPRLKQLIQESHDQPIWICEKKASELVQSQRLSYVSSPVSEASEAHDQESRMNRWSSDPMMSLLAPSYPVDFRRELKSTVELHSLSLHHSVPDDTGEHYNSAYMDDEYKSPYARPAPKHERYQLRPEDGYDSDSWRAPPVPEKSVLRDYNDDHAYDSRAYDSETRFNRPSRVVSQSLPRRFQQEHRPSDRNGWDSDALRYTRSTNNPYTKTAPIDRLKLQDIRSRPDRPMVPPKPLRSKSDSARFEDYPY